MSALVLYLNERLRTYGPSMLPRQFLISFGVSCLESNENSFAPSLTSGATYDSNISVGGVAKNKPELRLIPQTPAKRRQCLEVVKIFRKPTYFTVPAKNIPLRATVWLLNVCVPSQAKFRCEKRQDIVLDVNPRSVLCVGACGW